MPLDLAPGPRAAASLASRPLVDVRHLDVQFVSRDSVNHAVNDVSFSLRTGEVLCILGESGSGKSVTMRSLLKLHPSQRTRIAGEILVDGDDVSVMSERDMQSLRGSKISMIFQDPMTALDPVYTIGQQIEETIMRHRGASRKEAHARALELLELVRIPSPERRLKAYPHELSGGLRQRAMIAVALSCSPKLLLADEPTTALDATVQIQVLVLLRKLQQELGMGIIFVTHDLGVAAQIADRVAVMYAGRIVEHGTVEELLRDPRHPYTRGLLASTVHGHMRGKRIDAIPGAPPDLRRRIAGCAFAPRCAQALSVCHAAPPPVVTQASGRMVACVRADPAFATAAE